MDPSRTNDDPFHLKRFVDAQASNYANVLAELAGGRKRSHWMWFIFPQVQGLGSSSMAQRFAITDLHEAAAYLGHSLLGPRLLECTVLVNAVSGSSVGDIFGYPDDLKFHSSMTLFDRATRLGGSPSEAAENVFAQALTKFFSAKPDEGTLARL